MPSKPQQADEDIAAGDDDEVAVDSDIETAAATPVKKAVDRRRKQPKARTARTVSSAAEDLNDSTDDQADEADPVDAEVEDALGTEPIEAELSDSEAAGLAETLYAAAEGASDVTSPVAAEPTAAPRASSAARPGAANPSDRGLRRRVLGPVMFLLVVGGLGAAAYSLWPSINERYIQPVETTAADLTTVQGRLTDFDTRLDAIAADVAELENGVATNGDGLDDAASQRSLTVERLDAMDQEIARQDQRIDDLDDLAAALDLELGRANDGVAEQVEVTRAAERMSRARLFLFQANYGLASSDLTSARDTLTAIDASTTTEYAEVVDRLDRAIASLPEFPVSAAGDLDIAWETLLGNGSAPSAIAPTEVDDPAVPNLEAEASDG